MLLGCILQVKGQRRITFDQFVNALGIIAEKKGQALKDVVQPILETGGPSVVGTKAGYVKLHDDKVTQQHTICLQVKVGARRAEAFTSCAKTTQVAV